MKLSSQFSLRLACGAAVAAAGLLSAPGAFAQTTPTSFFFEVDNNTASLNPLNPFGDPNFPVTDALTFTNLQINETFQGGFTQTVALSNLSPIVTSGSTTTSTGTETSNTFSTSSPLISAILTGSIGTGPAQTINVFSPAGQTTQYVSSTFSANLFGPTPAGTGLGVFSLIDGNNNVIGAVNINAPAAVPEASTTISLGLLLALGLGGFAVSRRRTVSVK